LYRELEEPFLAREMASGSPKAVCDRLMQSVLQTDARDNVSLAVIDVSEAPRER
jgi:serine/threonine protein phosphatase PrpC